MYSEENGCVDTQLCNLHTEDQNKMRKVSVQLTPKTEEMLKEIKDITQMPISSILRYSVTIFYRQLMEERI
ncbi:hypothetical protein [Methanobrevibacter sp.]|uniref:hypothetical protein n=1 Tax=Methanobrevibacter sp. TaxID=66852 RepID=UPI00386813F9